MDVVTNQRHFVIIHQWAEDVVNHFLIDGAYEWVNYERVRYNYFHFLVLQLPKTVGSLTAARHISMRAE